jgi:alpha-1,2-mannosyltransferase
MLRRLVLAVTAVALVVVGYKINGHFDLKVYDGATRAWLHGGDLYRFVEHGRDRAYGFTYPPFGALVMAPIAVLPWPVATVVFDALTVAATLVVLRLTASTDALVLAAGLILAFAFDPWRTNYNYGQINMLLLALVTVDLSILVDRRRSAGVLVGVAAAVKLVPLIFIGYLLLTRRWRAALTAGASATAATLLMFAVAPHASWTFWTSAIWQSDRIGDPAFVSNQSLNGLVSRYELGRAVLVVLVVAALAGWGWQVWLDRDPQAGLAVTGVLACLISPITWVHHLVWLIPVIVLLARSRRPVAWGLALVSYSLLCSRLVWHFGARNLLSDTYLLVALLLVVVGHNHERQRRPRDPGRPVAEAHG